MEKAWNRSPAPSPVGKSSSLGRDQQPSLVCYSTFINRVFLLLLSRSRARIKSLKERNDQAKTRHKPSGTLSPSSSPPSPPHCPRASSYLPGCWAARGASPETRIVLLVCQDRRFLSDDDDTRPALLVWFLRTHPPPSLSLDTLCRCFEPTRSQTGGKLKET